MSPQRLASAPAAKGFISVQLPGHLQHYVCSYTRPLHEVRSLHACKDSPAYEQFPITLHVPPAAAEALWGACEGRHHRQAAHALWPRTLWGGAGPPRNKGRVPSILWGVKCCRSLLVARVCMGCCQYVCNLCRHACAYFTLKHAARSLLYLCCQDMSR